MVRGLLFALVLAGVASTAQATTIDQMRSACNVGADPTPNGSTPTSADGIVIASPREAKCALDRFKDILVIAPMRDLQQIPTAIPVVSLATPPGSAEAEAKYAPAVTKLTGGDLDRPVLVYCHHTSCGYSYNAAMNLKRLGYRNILWLREGLSGWGRAGYGLAAVDQIRGPVDEPSFAMWYSAAGDNTFGCFGEKKAAACDRMVFLLTKAVNDPTLPAKDRGKVASELFNAAAVRAENLREAGKTAEGYEAIKQVYASLMSYADGGAKVGVLSDNAKVLREYALASLEAGRAGDAQQFLTLARRDGGARYAQLANTAKGTPERKAIQGSMVAMEHLERDLAEFAAKKATTLYKADRKPEADNYRRLADGAVDHAILWIDRNGKEGVGHMMDLQPSFRISDIKLLQGNLAREAGDKAAAQKAFVIGGNAVCSIVDPETVKRVASGGEAKDMNEQVLAEQCDELLTAYYLVSPEFEKWAAAQAKREYDLYMSLLKD